MFLVISSLEKLSPEKSILDHKSYWVYDTLHVSDVLIVFMFK